jgi:hypothetical protein
MQNGGDDDNEDVEESPDIHFEPIVQLPEVVDLKTGEEEEEKLFCQRAKLYRFDNGQWKERGVGEMKILRNENTGLLSSLFTYILSNVAYPTTVCETNLQPYWTCRSSQILDWLF